MVEGRLSLFWRNIYPIIILLACSIILLCHCQDGHYLELLNMKVMVMGWILTLQGSNAFCASKRHTLLYYAKLGINEFCIQVYKL